MKLLDAPASDELEVSVFGPGYGECIVVHLGGGVWIVVDSCVRDREPVAAAYLSEIGVDLGAIAMIVATHWHDDHVAGLGELVARAPKATLVISGALQSLEFFEVVQAFGGDDPFFTPSKISAGLREMRTSLAHPDRKIVQALGDQRLLHEGAMELWALSPTQGDLRAAQRHLGKFFGKALRQVDPKRRVSRVPSSRPNHSALALWLRAGSRVVLLGSDLESPADATRGWSAVIASSARPQSRAFAVKIPHHGSRTAYHDDFWSSLAVDDPIAVVTPFVLGGISLPTQDDQRRLASHSSKLYATAPSRRSSASKQYSGSVRRMIEEVTGNSMTSACAAYGHVRIRASLSDTTAPPRVATFGAAHRIE